MRRLTNYIEDILDWFFSRIPKGISLALAMMFSIIVWWLIYKAVMAVVTRL